MPDEKPTVNRKDILNKNIRIVILIEDKERIAPQEQAKELAAETGFAIVKYRPNLAQNNKAKSKMDKLNNSKKKRAINAVENNKENVLEDVNTEETQSEWQLVYTKQGLALRLSNEPTWGDILVDFDSDALNYRKQYGGGRSEALVKAIGIKANEGLSVIDCTAGMGSDSFIMASVGAKVLMLERSPVIAALLEDALIRIKELPALSENLKLIKTDATDYLLQERERNKGQAIADVIYLDPMFPHKKKSALVKKEMRAFQQLLGEDTDSGKLLDAALTCASKRVVVKRPSYAEPIEVQSGRSPSATIESKKHRFDVYIQH